MVLTLSLLPTVRNSTLIHEYSEPSTGVPKKEENKYLTLLEGNILLSNNPLHLCNMSIYI